MPAVMAAWCPKLREKQTSFQLSDSVAASSRIFSEVLSWLPSSTKTTSNRRSASLLQASLSRSHRWWMFSSSFKTGMTRENHGKVWHIDHIIPCASFDLTDPDQQKKCFHYTNLQPLWAKENLIKGVKIL